MFSHLNEEIRMLNSDVNNVANSKRAKELRTRLLKIGIPLAVIGFGLAFACFVGFGLMSFFSVDKFEFNPLILIPFFLIIPCFVMGGIGATLTAMGLRITVTGYVTNLYDEVNTQKCPHCGDAVTADEIFCSKCGAQLKKECKNCGTVNDPNCNYCIKCGKSL